MEEENPSREDRLYLIPVPLSAEGPSMFYGPAFPDILSNIRLFIVEDPKTARRHLRNMGYQGQFDQVEMRIFNEHSSPEEVMQCLEEIRRHHVAGLMSEAGMPAMADPGEELVLAAHRAGIRIVPLPGASSIIMALVASGLNAEQFSFHGYLPVKPAERIRKLRHLEQIARESGATQIFMETPYRNQQMLEAILQVLQPGTMVCIATDLMTPSEEIATRSVSEWKKKPPELHRRLCVFLIGSGA